MAFVLTGAVPTSGDLNDDGVLDAADLSLVMQFFLGSEMPTPTQLAAADNRPKPGTSGRLYGDGEIGPDDVNWLLRRVVGLETTP